MEDSGPGIPDEYREKIFDQVLQVPGNRTTRRGSGLGLAFCKLAVDAHGGNIWVESQFGKGSIFAFTLPISDFEDLDVFYSSSISSVLMKGGAPIRFNSTDRR
ncbi:MAG: ATP-binding protein [Anaerolineales bacterium]|nr:ATP-binding protein [Anaerolineales bacterium]